ncbi:hypothetical protein LEP1GSC013_3611 [Leptospira interrogans serovar Valbuzzi str. Duyster]|nr:hypothetical protein LEP1GSC013_3611 [Leptospira interrogans serovar Valbuzzi str. Duyster]ENO71640.1 hypothetical protein LEP1GSC012_3451 [Leptospira interrogans serovar Valbuzzi str. Valbuzzi]
MSISIQWKQGGELIFQQFYYKKVIIPEFKKCNLWNFLGCFTRKLFNQTC